MFRIILYFTVHTSTTVTNPNSPKVGRMKLLLPKMIIADCSPFLSETDQGILSSCCIGFFLAQRISKFQKKYSQIQSWSIQLKLSFSNLPLFLGTFSQDSNNRLEEVIHKLEEVVFSLVSSFKLVGYCYLQEKQSLTPLISNTAEYINWNLTYSDYYLEFQSFQKGWGLFTRQFIPKGKYFLIYFGEMVKTKEMKRRYQTEYDSKVSKK
jgi:hypothetical protein